MMNGLGYSRLNYLVDSTDGKPTERPYPFGFVLAIHEIGPYRIAEILKDNSRLGNPSRESIEEHGSHYFHACGTCTSARTLEGALVQMIAYRFGNDPDTKIHSGQDHIAMCAMRVLGAADYNSLPKTATTMITPIPEELQKVIPEQREAIRKKVEAFEKQYGR